MAERFREKEAPKERLLPSVSRAEELHSPIDSLGRSASHIRLRSESSRIGAGALSLAERDISIASNVSKLKLEGSAPVRERFRQLLNALG